MEVKIYQKAIWKNRILLSILIVIVFTACKTNNGKVENSISNHISHDRIMDFSTSSSFIGIKIKANFNDTMTIVAPAEILQRYLRDGYSSDSLYRDAILKSTEKHLEVSNDIYMSFKSYRVDFSDDFINLWILKDKNQIVDSFFEKGVDGGYYACFEKEDVKNRVIFLLLKMGLSPYKDDETGCTVINDEADTNSR